MEENTDIEYHRDIIQKNVSKLNEIYEIFKAISHNILGGCTYITSDIGFKLDNSKKDPQYLNTQFNMFKIYLNAYIQLINEMIPELQKSQLIGLSLLHNLTKQAEQIGTPSFGLIDETSMMGIDVSNIGNNIDLTPDTDITQALFGNDVSITQQHQNVITLHDKKEENFEKIIDPSQEETDKTIDTFTDNIEDMDDIVIEKKEKTLDENSDKIPNETLESKSELESEINSELPDDKNVKSNEELKDKTTDTSNVSSKDKTTDTSNVSSKDKITDKISISSTESSVDYSVIFSIENPIDTNSQRNILLEEHPDEQIIKYYNIHDGPQLTDIVINDDIIIWKGGRENYFINFVLHQFKINPMFSAHDIYHLLCANLLPNYVSIAHLYDKYTQNYEVHLTNIKDQILIKIGFKSIMLSYISNDELFNEHKAYEIIKEWNDAFHELSFVN